MNTSPKIHSLLPGFNAQTRFRSFRSIARLTIVAAGCLILAQAAPAVTFTVVHTGDSGGGSFRDAITQADSSPGDDTIVFDLPGAGPHTIVLANGLFLSSNVAILNDRAGNEPITIQRNLASGTPQFRIFAINPSLTITIAGLTLSNGYASSSATLPPLGGAIHNQGSNLTLRSCTLSQNTAVFGGAIYNLNVNGGPDATLTMSNCTLSENTAVATTSPQQTEGGAISNAGFGTDGRASATLINCVLRQNSTSGLGGAISNNAGGTATASLILTDCTLSDNSASSAGGLYNIGSRPGLATTRMENCTLEGNQSGGGGGAIQNLADSRGSGRVSLLTCTLSGNRAGNTSSIGGGGIDNSGATAILTNCTFANLVGSNAQGQSVRNTNDGLVTAGNTLFVRNGIKTNFSNDATFTSRGHNLSNDDAGGDNTTGPGGLLNATGDVRNTQPLIIALASNGGPTQTRALQAGSPAINAGDDAIARDTDQRGYLRNGVSDVGAFEVGGLVPPALANISTRLRVETGDNVLIGGFIITGTQPKKVIVRGIGPSLPFSDKLANPTLELRDSFGTVVDSNDNWVDSPNKQAIIDSTIPPSNDLESAIVATLPANNAGYTAIVRGANNGTGIGVVEAYDLDRSVDSQLANISTRGFVQTGDNVLIAGTIVVGQVSQKVIIRAIGPSLPLPGKMGDPTLELRNASGTLLATNDNWRIGGQEAEIIATGIPPANDFESAIVFQLPANNASSTAIVRGAGNTTGIAVVEVYRLD